MIKKRLDSLGINFESVDLGIEVIQEWKIIMKTNRAIGFHSHFCYLWIN